MANPQTIALTFSLLTAKTKNVGFYQLLVPRIEAFALPSTVERATSKPTPIWILFSLYRYKTYHSTQ